MLCDHGNGIACGACASAIASLKARAEAAEKECAQWREFLGGPTQAMTFDEFVAEMEKPAKIAAGNVYLRQQLSEAQAAEAELARWRDGSLVFVHAPSHNECGGVRPQCGGDTEREKALIKERDEWESAARLGKSGECVVVTAEEWKAAEKRATDLRLALRGLLLSRDCSWTGGHDWDEAVEEAEHLISDDLRGTR